MRTLLIVIYLLFFFILGLPVLAVDWLIRKRYPQFSAHAQLRIVQWAFRCICFMAGLKLTVIGKENVPKDEAVLYIGNHRGFFDIVVTYMLCPRLTGYIAKSGINKVPVLRVIMGRLYCLFLDRDDIKQGLQVILKAIDYVKNGISICIFPEGTRNTDNEHPESLLPFKDGSFKIAQKTGCPIVPMAIIGTADVFENHLPWIKSTKVTLVYGKPIRMNELEKDDQKHIGSYCHDVIQQMLIDQLSS